MCMCVCVCARTSRMCPACVFFEESISSARVLYTMMPHSDTFSSSVQSQIQSVRMPHRSTDSFPLPNRVVLVFLLSLSLWRIPRYETRLGRPEQKYVKFVKTSLTWQRLVLPPLMPPAITASDHYEAIWVTHPRCSPTLGLLPQRGDA